MKVLIAGSGKMGADLFNYILPYGFEMIWLCLDETEAEKVRHGFMKKAGRQLRAGLINQDVHDNMMNRVNITSDHAAAAEVGLVIEAIWENAEAKQSLFTSLGRFLPSDAILTSNTSSIPLSTIFTDPSREAYCCGMHFFFPTILKNIVEINISEHTTTDVLEKLCNFLSHIERKFLVLPEPEHFLLNRLLLDVQTEALRQHLLNNMAVSDIDALVRRYIFPIGIFEFFDHVGLDVMLASVRNYATCDPEDRSLLIKGLEAKVGEHKLGVKNGEGFYTYPLDTRSLHCTLPEEQQQELLLKLEQLVFQAIVRINEKKIIDPADLDHAIMEYWGENLSLWNREKQ